MKLLITGGFGYLGGRLAQFLASHGGCEIVLGSRTQLTPPTWLPQAKVVQTQWNSPIALEQICSGVDTIAHLAGMNAQDCLTDPLGALQFNAVTTARLLQSAVRQDVKRFIYLSTAHVYGSPLAGVITEESCPTALHPYATSHRAAEDVVRAAHQRGEIEGIVIRLSNSYGAPAHKDADCWMLLVNDLCRQAITAKRMILHSSGMQRRDFVALTDACEAMRHLMMLRANELGDGLYNVGGGWSPTILEITQRVGERIRRATGDMPKILVNTAQSRETTESLEYGIRKLTGTGFNISKNGNVDREIDGVIQFCLRHFTESA